MIFTDAIFFAFLAIVFAGYWLLRGKEARLTLLLVASAVFYGWWDWKFLGLIAFVILVSWAAAKVASGQRIFESTRSKRFGLFAYLTGAVASTLAVIGLLPEFETELISTSDLVALANGFWALTGVFVASSVIGFVFSDGHENRLRRFWLISSIVSNLSVIAIFKYFGFFADSAVVALNSVGIEPGWTAVNILLPVGISFYVFQAISYIIDVARGDLEPEHRLRRVALYIAFFPQLVAGPIVRAASFFPQMERVKRFSGALFFAGLRAFALGFAYKAGIADNLAQFVDPVYGSAAVAGDTDLAAWSNLALIGATLAFAGLIYFDFAGYSLMAIGVARWFGYYIPKNFDYPYASPAIDDFWRRWHISLSSWLRDYLYIPLGGNRGGELKTYRNLMATMVLGGLWHGAAWTFVAWGAMHGAALAFHRALFKGKAAIGFVLGLIATQVFVLLTWVPFRADSFGDTATVWWAFTGLREGGSQQLSALVWLVFPLIALDALLGRGGLKALSRWSGWRRPVVYWGSLGALCGVLLALYPLEAAPFVYFQF